MAGPLDLRGRVIITDGGATATLGRIRSGLRAISDQAKSSSLHGVGDKLSRSATKLSGSVTAAGLGLRTILDQTKDFNEAKFGYGFARITDHIRNGKLDLRSWKGDVAAVAAEMKQASKSFGTLPVVTMRAREEVEKLGFKGDEAKSIFGATVGLHLSEPTKLSEAEAAKYVGAVYRAYAKQREELAARLGKDAEDPEFKAAYIKSLAGKAAVAGAESALGPADVTEGMRQFAPQWAAMGVDYDFALASLAHGSNYGFRASEIGTSLKSMMTKTLNPTADGLKTLNALGIDRAKFMTAAPVDPMKAANRINSLLYGALGGKGWGERKDSLVQMLKTGYEQGITGTPEFQQAVTQEVLRMLPKGYEGQADAIAQAVSNATISASGGIKLPEMIKEMIDKGASVGQIATFFEGRHVARYTPMFQYYEKLIALYQKIQQAGPEVIDATVTARKESEAGKTDQFYGAWNRLIQAISETGPIEGARDRIAGFMDIIAELPPALLDVGAAVASSVAIIVGAATALKIYSWWKAASVVRAGASGAAAVGTAGAVAGRGASAGGIAMPAAAKGIGAAGAAWTAAVAADGKAIVPIAGTTIAAGGTAAGASWASRGLGVAKGIGFFTPGVAQGLMAYQLWKTFPALYNGAGWLARLTPLGAALGLGMSAYSAYNTYQETGSAWEATKAGSGYNDIAAGLEWLKGILFGTPAQASEAPGRAMPDIGPDPSRMPWLGQGDGAGTPEQQAQDSADRVRQVFAQLDLRAEGARAAETWAEGFRSNIGSMISAVSEGAAAAKNAVSLNVGPSMAGAR